VSILRNKCKTYDRARELEETFDATERPGNRGKIPKAFQCWVYVHLNVAAGGRYSDQSFKGLIHGHRTFLWQRGSPFVVSWFEDRT
jgi:hypothetical protein